MINVNAGHNIRSFRIMKEKGDKIAMLTAYDCATARAVQAAGIDVVLVGDSLGMVVLGYESTLQVTMDDMARHSQAVRRGAPEAFIIADLPYMSYHVSTEDTKKNASRLIIEAGANAVKLEGGSPARVESIRAILDCEIPVCGHIGLTPQSIVRFGGYKVQGKTPAEHDRLMEEAFRIEQAGAFMLVLEGISEELGKAVTEAVQIPTIGIGAGRFCDGQVLVFHDLLGWSSFVPKFVRQYAQVQQSMTEAIQTFVKEVKDGSFPTREQIYYPID